MQKQAIVLSIWVRAYGPARRPIPEYAVARLWKENRSLRSPAPHCAKQRCRLVLRGHLRRLRLCLGKRHGGTEPCAGLQEASSRLWTGARTAAFQKDDMWHTHHERYRSEYLSRPESDAPGYT